MNLLKQIVVRQYNEYLDCEHTKKNSWHSACAHMFFVSLTEKYNVGAKIPKLHSHNSKFKQNAFSCIFIFLRLMMNNKA